MEKEEKNLKEESQKAKQDVKEKVKQENDTKKKEENANKSNAEGQKDSTFKKVENVNIKNEPKESKHVFLKAILVLVGILIVCYCIFITRNFLILNNIMEKAKQYENMSNYSYEIKSGETEYIYSEKDNVIRFETIINGEVEEGTESHVIMWQDLNTKEIIKALPDTKEAMRATVNISLYGAGDFPFQMTNFEDIINGLSLYALIYSEKYNDKDCYVMQINSNTKIWVEKDTALVLKQEITRDDYTEVTETVNAEVNTVDEIYKPDLTGYNVVAGEISNDGE